MLLKGNPLSLGEKRRSDLLAGKVEEGGGLSAGFIVIETLEMVNVLFSLQ